MARMVPDWDDDQLEEAISVSHAGYDGERKLYKELRKLPDDWVVVYDRTVSDGTGANQTDFLVFVPGKGIVNVDAKGGHGQNGYHLVDGVIYLGNERNDIFGKARAAIRRVDSRIKTLLNIQPNHVWGAFGALIVFTTIDLRIPYEDDSSYVCATELFDSTRHVLRDRIIGILDQHSEAHAFFRRFMTQILNRWTITDPGTVVSSEFRDNDSQSAVMLNVPQREILGLIERNGSQSVFHVMGAAGTGKTLLGCMLARHFARLNKRVLFVCFNEFLSQELKARHRGFTITNFHKIGQLIGRNDLLVWNDSELRREASASAIREAFNCHRVPKFDVLIVDEAQDLLPDEISVLLLLLKRDRKIVIFSDKGQSLYSLDWNLCENELVPDGQRVQSHVLLMNFRNKENIFNHFKRYNVTENDDALFCFQRDGVVQESDQGAIDLAKSLLEGGDGIRGKDIVILATSLRDLPNDTTIGRVSVRRSHDAYFHRRDNVLASWVDDSENFILATTEKQFKGLESNIVIFINSDNNAEDAQRYVAESRAKYRLYVVNHS